MGAQVPRLLLNTEQVAEVAQVLLVLMALALLEEMVALERLLQYLELPLRMQAAAVVHQSLALLL